MKPKNFSSKKMMLCVAIVAMSMAMTSCSDNDDNGALSSEEEYQIEVGEGMTLPVNEFLKVPAVAGDQNVINSSLICFLLQFEVPRFPLDCLYFRPKCVNLPKSLHFYKLFS